ncbi:tRNA (cytosine(38)-C(5))-methyltransferase isoform X2 [Heteronotia binoei]|uniref:tRNA (cytosine(38)-C(5))-methyltransferase isoform X2 n=1 Tax=Heteronotia binoei TaxID=13085 RepID=UPI00292EC11E|nr:tRNA (cytosine(38)-C(5))-methyltransferase isoform X2 [Heteronotia binoei]
MERLRVLELYSGIGGMHQALQASGTPADVVAAVDVNTVANEVYKLNFPTTPLWPKTIEGISLKEFDRLSFDMILMSPPCQPFTRIGRQGDTSDPRTRSFLYILDILPRDELVQTLGKCGFTYQEFLLSPTCLGIPNSRLRYFLIARLQSEPFPFQAPDKILTVFPSLEPMTSEVSRDATGLEADGLPVPTKGAASSFKDIKQQCRQKEDFLFKLETTEELEKKKQKDNDVSVQMLKDFLEEDGEGLSQYFLPPKSLLRYAFLLDIVTPTCRRSTCFTKGYGHYIEGTGSVLQTAEDIQLESVFKSFENLSEEEKLRKLTTLKLRYFAPREIANLHGFSPEFDFPHSVTTKQCYRLLGNSLNVHVVAKLISILLGEH